mmetsp:Transcript_12335/g.32793  ORF Transcript_12335/g.32793 Transcript_12335/m.32793 type:complete len:350 (+) Transcript_12335:2-1051(+)
MAEAPPPPPGVPPPPPPPFITLHTSADVDSMYRSLASASASASASVPSYHPWLPYLRTHSNDRPPLVRLFCFPWAGAGASAYGVWQRRFTSGELDDGKAGLNKIDGEGPSKITGAKHVQLCAVQMPGREHRANEAPCENLKQAARDFVRDCKELLASARVAFFGHGCGSWMAYEVALEMRRNGMADPVLLVVSNWPAPQTPLNARPWRRVDALDNDELIREGRLWGWPEHIFREDFWPYIEPSIRADQRFFDTYEPIGVEEPLSCPIVAYVSQDDPKFGPRKGTPEFLEAWARLSTRMHMEIECWNGDHYYLQDEKLRHKVAKSVARRVADIAQLIADMQDDDGGDDDE